MRKYSIEDVQNILSVHGYRLLDDVYVGSHSPIRIECDNGHFTTIILSNFICGQRCGCCSGRRKLSIDYVRRKFLDVGYTLLSDEYVNAHSKLRYRCTDGHTSSITWANFSAGKRCSKCYNDANKISVNEITSFLVGKDLTLVSKVYVNNYSNLIFRCANGHVFRRSWANLRRNTDCPECIKFCIEDKNKLSVCHPNISEEWHNSKNKNITPDMVSGGSGRRVWWRCVKCGHVWRTAVYNRTIYGSGCPKCSSIAAWSKNRRSIITDKNRLSVIRPDLVQEWDVVRNGRHTPDTISVSSNKKVWWKCHGCGNSWKTAVSSRTNKHTLTGCPKCWLSSVSRVSQRWLDTFGISAARREYQIAVGGRKYVVDGFDPETNTIYEFLGDYWHGNPNGRRRRSGITCINGKTFEELYRDTQSKLESISRAGYRVVYVWESDFRDGSQISCILEPRSVK